MPRSRPRSRPHPALALALLALLLAPAPAPSRAQARPFAPVWQAGGASQALLLAPAGAAAARLFAGVGPTVLAVDAVDANGEHSPLLPGVVTGLARSGDLLLATLDSGRLALLDAGDPALAPLGGLDIGGALDVAALDRAGPGALALVARDDAGLDLVDLSDPAAPRPRGHLDLPPGTQAMDLALAGALALVAGGVTGLHLVDPSDPDAPTAVASLAQVDGFPLLVEAVIGGAGPDEAWICDGPRVHRVDLSQPGAPRIAGSIELGGVTCRALALDGPRLAVLSVDQLDAHARLHRFALGATEPRDLGAVDLTPAGLPAGLFETPRPRLDLALDRGGAAYAALGGQGLVVLPDWLAPEPELRALAASAGGPAWPEAVALDGPRAFVASGPLGMQAYGPDTGDGLAQVADLPLPGYARDLVARDTELLVAAEAGGIRRFRLAPLGSPGAGAAPLAVGALESLTAVSRLALAEHHVYAADGLAGLRIVALEPAGGLRDIGGIDLDFDFPEGLAYDRARRRLLVAHGSGVSAYDLADEAAPRRLWRVETPGFARDVEAYRDEVLVADDQAGLTLIWDPPGLAGAPTELETWDTPGSAQAVSAWTPPNGFQGLMVGALAPRDSGLGGVAWLADGEGGLVSFELDWDWPPNEGAGFGLPREAVAVAAADGRILLAARGSGVWLFHEPGRRQRHWKIDLPWLRQDAWPGP